MNGNHSQTDFLNAGCHADSSEETNRLAGIIMNEIRKIVWTKFGITTGVDLEDVVHQTYVKLAASTTWKSRKHFYCTAATAIRNLRVDSAKRRRETHLDSNMPVPDAKQSQLSQDLENAEKLLQLDNALQQLARTDPEAAEVVELRYFGIRLPTTAEDPGRPVPAEGLRGAEIAELLDVSQPTVSRRLGRGLLALRMLLEGKS